MRIGSLFSGIGGLELGLEWAGVGTPVWQVEQSAYCRAVLARHWPDVERFEDVRSVGAHNLASVDLLCGGFPCQDVSSAGKRAGLAGARSGLWFEYLRVVRELRPAFVVVENVASGARAWVDTVCQGLGEQGYACLPVPLAAADVGASHERARVFIVAAHTDADSKLARPKHAEVARTQAAPDLDRAQLWLEPGRRRGEGGTYPALSGFPGWRTSEPNMVRMVHGVSRRLDKPTARRQALGNAVVPQCAEVIGHIIQILAEP